MSFPFGSLKRPRGRNDGPEGISEANAGDRPKLCCRVGETAGRSRGGARAQSAVETKGVHLKASKDADYKRSVIDICGKHARCAEWAEFVPAMQDKMVQFEVVGEDEWQTRLNGMLFPGAGVKSPGE